MTKAVSRMMAVAGTAAFAVLLAACTSQASTPTTVATAPAQATASPAASAVPAQPTQVQATPTAAPAGPTGTAPAASASTPGAAVSINSPFGDLFLEVTAPAIPEVVVSGLQYQVQGLTTVDATISVNDKFVDVNIDGQFSQVVELEPGPNLIEVVASDPSGTEKSTVLVIISES